MLANDFGEDFFPNILQEAKGPIEDLFGMTQTPGISSDFGGGGTPIYQQDFGGNQIMQSLGSMYQMPDWFLSGNVPKPGAAPVASSGPTANYGEVDRSSREGFIRSVAPYAMEVQRATGIPAAALVALDLNQRGWAGATRVPRGSKEEVITAAAREFGIRPDIFDRQLTQEGAKADDVWNSTRYSSAGARGPGQFMPATAAEVARQLGVPLNEFWADPVLQVRGAALHMRDLLSRYKGDYARALAAYNAGAGAVDQYGGVPPYAETQTYIARILGADRPSVMPNPILQGGTREAYTQFANSIRQNAQYQAAIQYLDATGDQEGFIRQIAQAGFSDDPAWGDRIIPMLRDVARYLPQG